MSDTTLVGCWIRRFLMEHLVGERNLALNTRASYRDMLTLLLPFAAKEVSKPVDRLSIEDFSPEVVRSFLGYVEQERRCSGSTRNQRLAAIHALARFIGERSPEHIAWSTKVRAIPFKKTSQELMSYLEKPEMDALLDAPDRGTVQGFRDHAVLLFLYNTGARADEVAHVTIADLELSSSPAVRIMGKGRKARLCPLWSLTASTLDALIVGRRPDERVFLNRRRQHLTRHGIYTLVKRYLPSAERRVPSMAGKKISPHSIRHTCAVHLLRAGVDINTIRAWLGHVSLDVTHVYAEVDLEMKAKALAHCEVSGTVRSKSWHTDRRLMAFLRAL